MLSIASDKITDRHALYQKSQEKAVEPRTCVVELPGKFPLAVSMLHACTVAFW